MATDYDAVRPDIAEQNEATLKTVQNLDSGDARTLTAELEESEMLDGAVLPGAIVDDELVVQVIPQGEDEFTCGSCFLVRHRSQLVLEKAGMKFCRDCEG